MITYLIKEITGEKVDDHEGMCAIVRDYFSEWFERNSENFEVDFAVGARTVSKEHNLKPGGGFFLQGIYDGSQGNASRQSVDT